ncbi:MAG: hypothetical protein ACR2P6_10210 [Gammaproteobacteria bacterium]
MRLASIQYRLCILALCAGLMACAAKTSVSGTWAADNKAVGPYANLLVLAVAESLNNRMSFENALVDNLQNDNTTARPSHQVLGPELELSEENIRQAIESTDGDAVLIIRLLSQEITPVEVPERVDTSASVKGGNPVDFFRYDYEDIVSPEYLKAKRTVTLSSELYESGSQALIYSINSTAYDRESTAEIIADLSKAIAKQLRRDGLTR